MGLILKENLAQSLQDEIENSSGMVKLDSVDIKGYLTDKIDNVTIVRIGDKLVIKSIDGMTVGVDKLNLLTGATTNIQQQIDNLSKIVSVHSIVNTKADLPVVVLPVGTIILVRQDEEHTNLSTFYISNGTTWEYVGKINSDIARDFLTQPINLANETTGILPKAKYEKQNALETPFNGIDAKILATNTEGQ